MNTDPALAESFNRLVVSVQDLGDVVFHQSGWVVLLCIAAGIVLYNILRHFEKRIENRE